MVWKYEKFRGDAAIYAFCPKCNFRHCPSDLVKDENVNWDTKIRYQYNYCPICGEFLYNDSDNAEVVWNERDVAELYAM